MADIVAIEGTHGSGKSTFATALTSRLLADGITTSLVTEVVRENPVIVDMVRTGATFTLAAEIQLASHHIFAEQSAAARSDVVVVDRSAMNVLAYIAAQPDVVESGGDQAALADTFQSFLLTYSTTYAGVFLCGDMFQGARNDPMRSGTHEWQNSVRRSLDDLSGSFHCPVSRIPPGLTSAERVDYALERLAEWHVIE